MPPMHAITSAGVCPFVVHPAVHSYSPNAKCIFILSFGQMQHENLCTSLLRSATSNCRRDKFDSLWSSRHTHTHTRAQSQRTQNAFLRFLFDPSRPLPFYLWVRAPVFYIPFWQIDNGSCIMASTLQRERDRQRSTTMQDRTGSFRHPPHIESFQNQPRNMKFSAL